MLQAELSDVALYGSMPRFGDMSIHAVLDLRRAFARAELERALVATIEAFPVLGRRYEPRFWRDVWRPVEAPVSDAVHVVDEPRDVEAETAAWARRSIDVHRDRPVRIVSLRRGEGSRVVLSLSHLAVDGGGAAAVGHVLGANLYGVRPSLPVDARRDAASALERVRWWHLPQLARDVAALLAHPWKTLRTAPRARPYPADRAGTSSWRHLVVSSKDAARVRATCRDEGATLNDALVAALARAGARRSNARAVSVVYTMDLRRYQGAARLTAANTSTFLSALVPREAIGDFASTVRAVARLTANHKRGLAGPAMLLTAMAMSAGAPHGVLRRVVPKLHPALVDVPLSRGLLVTNVGRLDEGLAAFGDDVEAVRIIGPMIAGADVPAIVACGFRGEIQLELFAPAGVAEAALDELESELREALEIA